MRTLSSLMAFTPLLLARRSTFLNHPFSRDGVLGGYIQVSFVTNDVILELLLFQVLPVVIHQFQFQEVIDGHLA